MNNAHDHHGDNDMNNAHDHHGDNDMNNAHDHHGDNDMNSVTRPTQTESERAREAFIARLHVEVQRLCQELAKEGEGLTYADARNISLYMRNFFLQQLHQVPTPVEAWLEMGEAVLAPSARESMQHIKKVLALSGGAVGLYLVLSSLAVALGWGAGILATIKVWLLGVNFTGPIGWGATGAALLLIAGYVCTHDDADVATERYMKVMTSGIDRAVHRIWNEHGAALRA